MLSPQQVLPFLLHEDYDVREHAAGYLADGVKAVPSLVSVTADPFWESIDRYGLKHSRRLLSRLHVLPQTDASLSRTLSALTDDSGGDDDEDGASYSLQYAVSDVDFSLLQARREELLNAAALHPRVREHLAERLALAELPPAELWDRLLQHSEDNKGKNGSDLDRRVSECLIEALARHGDVAADLAMKRLTESDEHDWMELFAIDLLGQLRHAPAADLLLQRAAVPDDHFMPGRCADALARIGTIDVIAKIEVACGEQSSHYTRMEFADALKKIKRPESEQALIRLLEVETEEEARASMGAALCDLCTTEGLEAVRDLIVLDRFDTSIVELDELLVTLSKMTGYAPPELASWTKTVADRIADRERRMKQFGGRKGFYKMLGRMTDLLASSGATRESHLGDDDWEGDSSDPASLPPPPGTISPIRRDTPKVGRNDPCPCGSGKKYKKCCQSKTAV